MKHLNDVLKESLLDDEEDLMKNTDVAISLQKHPIWRFSKGWVILDPPQEMRGYGYNHQPNIFIGDKSHGDEWDPAELKLYKFQGLGAITIGSDADITSILKDINCDYCGWLDIQNHKSKLIDLTKIGFPLTHLLRITTIEPVDIKAYNKHIGFVHLANSRYTSKICFTPDNVKGWDCDYLVVDASYFTVDGPIVHGENKLNGFWIDRCQTLINNNPKAKEIYLYDRNLDVFFRLSISGSKRVFKNVVNRKKMLNRIYDHAIFQAKNQAEGWRYDGHQDLYESLLDDDIEFQFSPEDMEKMMLWNSLCGTRQKHTQTITALRYYISTEKKCKSIKLPLSSQRGRRVDVDPNKYYIKFTVNREGESIIMGLARGDEQMYTWDIPRTENYTCKPTRFVSLTTSKIKKDLSHSGKDVLYELPNELVWLYEKIKKEVRK